MTIVKWWWYCWWPTSDHYHNLNGIYSDLDRTRHLQSIYSVAMIASNDDFFHCEIAVDSLRHCVYVQKEQKRERFIFFYTKVKPKIEKKFKWTRRIKYNEIKGIAYARSTFLQLLWFGERKTKHNSRLIHNIQWPNI